MISEASVVKPVGSGRKVEAKLKGKILILIHNGTRLKETNRKVNICTPNSALIVLVNSFTFLIESGEIRSFPQVHLINSHDLPNFANSVHTLIYSLGLIY